MIMRVTFLVLLGIISARADASTDTAINIQQVVEVRDSDPFFGESYYKVFYAGAFVVYKSQYSIFQHIVQDESDSASEQPTGKSGTADIKSSTLFFVFNRDSSYGVMYDSGNIFHKYESRMPVDSAMKGIKTSFGFENLLVSDNPDSTTWDPVRQEREEMYFIKEKTDTPAVHLRLYYSGIMNQITESLYPAADRIKKMKLHRVEAVLETFYDKKREKQWPSFKFLTDMKEVQATGSDLTEIESYIDRYKKVTQIK